MRLDDPGLTRVAARHGTTPRQVALAWLLATAPVTLAIPGTSSPTTWPENVVAAGPRLTPDGLAELIA